MLAAMRSCGHVTVQDWKAIVWDCCSMGGTGVTSLAFRYFSIRRIDTKLWSILMKVSGSALRANFNSLNTVEGH